MSMYLNLIASVSNLQVGNEGETLAGPRHCQASGRSLVSGGIGRSTASAGEQNVHGIDKQSGVGKRSAGPRSRRAGGGPRRRQ